MSESRPLAKSRKSARQIFLAGVVCSLIVMARSIAAHTSN